MGVGNTNDTGYRRLKLYEKSPVCGICTTPLTPLEAISSEVNIDHIRPKAHGGTDDYTNLQLD